MLELEKVKKRIAQLDELEAKSLLVIIYARLDMTINRIGEDEFARQSITELHKIFHEIPDKKN